MSKSEDRGEQNLMGGSGTVMLCEPLSVKMRVEGEVVRNCDALSSLDISFNSFTI